MCILTILNMIYLFSHFFYSSLASSVIVYLWFYWILPTDCLCQGWAKVSWCGPNLKFSDFWCVNRFIKLNDFQSWCSMQNTKYWSSERCIWLLMDVCIALCLNNLYSVIISITLLRNMKILQNADCLSKASGPKRIYKWATGGLQFARLWSK